VPIHPNTAGALRLASTEPHAASQDHLVAADATSLVREAFRVWVVGASEDVQLRRALRSFCDAAHVRHLQPQEVLIALKRICRSVPEVRDARTRDGSDALIARVVTMCIQEFYAAPADARPRRANGLSAR
jgi:hypothetical protein